MDPEKGLFFVPWQSAPMPPVYKINSAKLPVNEWSNTCTRLHNAFILGSCIKLWLKHCRIARCFRKIAVSMGGQALAKCGEKYKRNCYNARKKGVCTPGIQLAINGLQRGV